jgi:hypothetical protein
MGNVDPEFPTKLIQIKDRLAEGDTLQRRKDLALGRPSRTAKIG